MLFDILCNCIGFQVVDDFHLQVSGLLGFLPGLGFSTVLLSAITRTLVFFWLPRPRFNGFSFSSTDISVEKKASSSSMAPSSVYLSSRLPITSRSLLTISHMGW